MCATGREGGPSLNPWLGTPLRCQTVCCYSRVIANICARLQSGPLRDVGVHEVEKRELEHCGTASATLTAVKLLEVQLYAKRC